MVAKSRRALIAFFLLLPAAPSGAVFHKSQMDRIDTERRFDSEYFLDLLGFSPPLDWEDDWSASTGAYRINAASLDCCDLLLRQELKYRRALLPHLDFAFKLVQSADKDFSEQHHWLELDQALPAGLSAQLFGEPRPEKEDSDIGLGAAWSPADAPGLKAAARRTWVDFVFNQRGSTSQSYTRKPLTDEFRLDWTGRAGKAWALAEFDHPLRRSIPDENRLYSYRRTTARIGWRGPLAGLEGRLEYSYEFLREGDLRNPDPGGSSVDFSRQVHSLDLRGARPLGPGDAVELGAILFQRTARADFVHQESIGVFYRRWELQPYARWRRRVSDRLETELGGLLALGENRRRFPSGAVPSAFDTTAEAKLDASAAFRFSQRGRLALSASFDLDSPARFWDGGGVRALFPF